MTRRQILLVAIRLVGIYSIYMSFMFFYPRIMLALLPLIVKKLTFQEILPEVWPLAIMGALILYVGILLVVDGDKIAKKLIKTDTDPQPSPISGLSEISMMMVGCRILGAICLVIWFPQLTQLLTRVFFVSARQQGLGVPGAIEFVLPAILTFGGLYMLLGTSHLLAVVSGGRYGGRS